MVRELILEINPDVLLALGAVLSGLGSLIAGISSIKITKRRATDECDKRIRELERAFRRGMQVRPRGDGGSGSEKVGRAA